MIGWNEDVVTILAVDPSLRQTGYALLQANYDRNRIDVLYATSLNNRYYGAAHGLLLQNIFDKTVEMAKCATQFVREGAVCTPMQSQPIMHKVHGAMEMALWQAQKRRFIDIPVGRIRDLVCGNPFATKHAVRVSLERYVGSYPYESNDESDAVAVGVAYLIEARRLDMSIACHQHRQKKYRTKGGMRYEESDTIAFG